MSSALKLVAARPVKNIQQQKTRSFVKVAFKYCCDIAKNKSGVGD